MSPGEQTHDETDHRAHLARTHTRTRADEYAAYLYEHGIKPLEEKALGVQQLREDRAERIRIRHHLLLGQCGGDVGLCRQKPAPIHHLPRDPEFLIELPQSIQVLEITSSYGNTGGGD